MKKYRLISWWKLLIVDTVALALVLSVFCYFHHIREMWFLPSLEDGDEPSITTAGMIRPPKATTPQNNSTKPPVTQGTDGPDGTASQSGENNTDPPEPVDEGDFGARFPGVFLAEGELISEPDRYVSHDISITYNKVTIQISGHDVMYHYYDVYIRNIENLYTVTITGTTNKSLDSLEKMGSQLTDENDELKNDGLPVLSMNGDFWKRNKALIAERNYVLYKESDYINNDICVLYYDGTMEVITPSEFNLQEVKDKIPYQIWYFGPGLLNKDGEPRGESSSDYKVDGASYNGIIGGRNPRAALGYYEPGHYAFVVVDGRSDASYGINVPNLAKIMSDIGCKVAYNLDGGNSAQVKFNGEYQRKSDQKQGQRSLNDIVCVGEVIKKD